MRTVFRVLAIFGAILFLAALHIGSSYILPHPWSKINIIFIVLILFLLWKDTGSVIWLAFFVHFLIELYTTTPFGVVLFSSTISMLLSFWLYKNLFTNRSWYAATGLLFFTMITYRLIYSILLLVLKIFNFVEFIPWKLTMITFGWELLLTLPMLAIIHLFLSIFSAKFRSTNLDSYLFRI